MVDKYISAYPVGQYPMMGGNGGSPRPVGSISIFAECTSMSLGAALPDEAATDF